MEHTVDSPQQCAPRLVMEHDDHARGRQGWAAPKRLFYASRERKIERNSWNDPCKDRPRQMHVIPPKLVCTSIR